MLVLHPIFLEVREPIDTVLDRICSFIGAETFQLAEPGLEYAQRVLVGPRDTLRLHVDKGSVMETICEVVPGNGSNALAWGVHFPADLSLQPPLLMLYKQVAALGNHPVLVSERHFVPGELVVVPESSETFAVISLESSSDPLRCLQWFVWRGASKQERISHSLEAVVSDPPEDSIFRMGSVFVFSDPILKQGPLLIDAQLTSEVPFVQVGPVLDREDFDRLNEALLSAPWLRREGEIYTQDSLDLSAWIRSGNGSAELAQLIDSLKSQAFAEIVGRLFGVRLDIVREIYAYRLRPQERILVHADSTSDGQLVLRMNLLLSVPEGRAVDFRFWNPAFPENPVTVFHATPNFAVCFLMGPETPHDVPPVPLGAHTCRVNIVLTFGQMED